MKKYMAPHSEEMKYDAVSVIATSSEPREVVKLEENIGNIVVPTAKVGAAEIFG